MGSTSNYSLTYPESSSHARIWEHIQTLATELDTLVAGLESKGALSGGRIATGTETSDSAGITTTETQIVSATASLVAGRTYKVCLMARLNTTVAGQSVILRIREGSVAGAELFGDQFTIPMVSSVGNPVKLEWEYTAAVTGSVTLVGTMVRNGGTATVNREAASTRPTYLYVDYISG